MTEKNDEGLIHRYIPDDYEAYCRAQDSKRAYKEWCEEWLKFVSSDQDPELPTYEEWLEYEEC